MRFKNGNYSLEKIGIENGVSAALGSFSDKIVNGIDNLTDKLTAIANSVTFNVPAMASGGVVPYSISSTTYIEKNISGTDIDNLANDLTSVIIQTVTNATVAIVNAIEENGDRPINLDGKKITATVVENHNNQVRATGKSPLKF